MSGGRASGPRPRSTTSSLRAWMADAPADHRPRANGARAVGRFAAHRPAPLAELGDPDGLRHAARDVRQQVLARLPELLERFADAAIGCGADVCWASSAVEARNYVARVVQTHDARQVVTSRSMAAEEIALASALEARGTEVVETDAPGPLGEEPDELMGLARERQREALHTAAVGITGANLAVAATGSIVLVADDQNARLVTALPRAHVVVLGMERLVADWNQADLLLALLARSATGQRPSARTTIVTGPRGAGGRDGPEELHIVVLDNGRSRLLGGPHHEVLTCVRCGGCLDVGPGYRPVGAAAYGWVHPGPTGPVLMPLLTSGHVGPAELANASTLCGACLDACPVEIPVGIPLQDALVARCPDRAAVAGRAERTAWRLWAAAWSDPCRYAATTRAATWDQLATGLAGRLPAMSSWATGRAVPSPAADRFRDRWRKGLV